MTTALHVPHARDAVDGAQLKAALQTLGAFALNNGFEDQISAYRLHGHFPVSSGEVVLDRVNTTERKIVRSVVPAAHVTCDQEASWGFTPDGTRVALGWNDAAQVNMELATTLEKIGTFLADQGLTTILAVSSRREYFPVGAGEMLFERTNEHDRMQYISVVARNDVRPEHEVSWRFTWNGTAARGRIKPADVILVAVQGCDPGCYMPDSL